MTLQPQFTAFENASISVGLSDPAARMFALTQLVAAVESSDSSTLGSLAGSEVSADLLQRLRGMPLGEAWRFALAECGLTIAVDAAAVRSRLHRVDRAREDREILEYLVRHGASPALLTRLFGLSHSDARRMRKALAPHAARGGRPSIPGDEQWAEIEAHWGALSVRSTCLKARFRDLHAAFPSFQVCSLEIVVAGRKETVCLGASRPRFSATFQPG